MAKTKIEWTDNSWNPLRVVRKDTGKQGWACVKVAPECKNCYAETLNQRGLLCGTSLPYTVPSLDLIEPRLDEKTLNEPLRWRKPRKIFPCSMTDLFWEFWPDGYLYNVFCTMQHTPQHRYIVLTKRGERMAHWASSFYLPKNAAFLVSAGTQKFLDEQVPHIHQVNIPCRGLSAEPLLEPLNLREYLEGVEDHGIAPGRPVGTCLGYTPPLDWVIVGTESGHGARPYRIEWVESIVDQCRAAGVPCFVKQLTDKRGQKIPFENWPESVKVREWPELLEGVGA